MIAVDSSVWIDHLNDRRGAEVMRLRAILEGELEIVAIGDLILCEVLQGFSSDRDAARVEAAFRSFEWVAMTSPSLAIKAASNYRALRSRGITVRKTIDLLIGTWCIERGVPLLHSDRDFDPMAEYLGLGIVGTREVKCSAVSGATSLATRT